MLYYMADVAYGNISGFATDKERKKFTDYKIKKLDPQAKSGIIGFNTGSILISDVHGAENGRVRFENKELVQQSYYED